MKNDEIKLKKETMKKKYIIHLRSFISFISISTLFVSCLIACGIVITGTWLFYHGPITFFSGILMSLLVCALTMIIGAIALYIGSGHLLKPVEALNSTVNKIAKGDFTARVYRKKER